MDAASSTSDWLRALRELPKASLHVHLEGALRWSTVRDRHPDGALLPAAPPWLQRADPFADFGAFLDVFQRYLRPATGSADAIERHTQHALEDLAALGVVGVDLIVSVPFHRERGLGQREVLDAVAQGCARAAVLTGIEVQIVYGVNRHRALDEVTAELDEALALAGAAPDGLIAAIDLQGDERVGRARDYRPLFRQAEAAGLRLRAHAGELCGPDSVREVLDELGVQHLSHGVRAVEDAALLGRLARDGIWLHVCPTSNQLLHVLPDRRPHPLRQLLDAGCRVTLDADDPLMFGTDIAREGLRAIAELGLSPAEVAGLAEASLHAWPLDATARERASAEVERWRRRHA